MIGAVAALVIATAVLREVRMTRQWQRVTVTLDTLRRFDEEWTSDSFAASRSAAAQALLSGRRDTSIGDVLTFFDEIAFWIDRRALDEESVWHHFYWPMANYWYGSEEYRKRPKSGGAGWEHLARIMPRLAELEVRHRKDSTPKGIPDKDQIRDFLTAEAGMQGAPCEENDDQETNMTPL